MLSLIICSRHPDISPDFRLHLAQTIGIAYEIIVIDNSRNEHSIYTAYNLGMDQSRYPFLCFIHEDILFNTGDWGQLVVRYFNEIDRLGCLGVGGAVYKTKSPSGWWAPEEADWALHIIQHFRDQPARLESIGWGAGETSKEVAVIDGVFMAVRKSDGLRFDEDQTGFHGYDLNLCMECRKKGLKVMVTREILLEHFSIGTVNTDWYRSMDRLHRKYAALLPASVQGPPTRPKVELNSLELFIRGALDAGLKGIAFQYWLQFIRHKPVSRLHLSVIRKLL